MPYGRPPFVQPWTREYWPLLEKGKKLYSIVQWQCHLINGDLPIPPIHDAVCAELNIPPHWIGTKAYNLLTAKREAGEYSHRGPGERENQASDEGESEDSDFRGFESPTSPVSEDALH